jgi:multiple sugar transport system permease protein
VTSDLLVPAEGAGRASVPAGTGRRRAARRRHALTGAAFVTPFFIVFLCFLVIPLLYALRMSLYTSTIVQGEHFSGLANYTKAFSDPEFLHGVLRVLLFGAVQIPVMLGTALAVALMLDALTTRLARVLRTVIFMPYAVPAVIGALMWGFLYSPSFGPAHTVGRFLGLGNVDLLSSHLMLASLGNVVTWQWTGYNTIVLYAALQGLPREIYDAAHVDGAGPVRLALRVKVPMISSALVLAIVFCIIGTLQFFTEPRVMRAIASSVITPSYTPNLYAYNLAFQYSEFDYSAAISFALGAVAFVGSYVFLFVMRRRSGLR